MSGFRWCSAAVVMSLAACGLQLEPSTPRPTSRVDELRPDSPNTPEPAPAYSATDVVEKVTVPDASVVVHFTRMGSHAVPLRDADDSGVPDFVESVETVYAQVRATYHGPWRFRVPPNDALVPGDNGGDDRFDVYLLDFAGRADGAFRSECLSADPIHCTGYMVQENDFTGYHYPTPNDGVITVSSHEYFHAVQAGYSSRQSVVLTEGTAVWATERFAPQLDDLEGFSGSYLSAPDRSLDTEPTTAVDGYAYGAGLFFECLTALRGDDAVLDLWERIDGGTGWLPTLQSQLAEDGGLTLPQVIERCADYNLFTGSRARAGYGHARAQRLSTAMASVSTGLVQVPRARMFRASSRYYEGRSLPAGAVAWWKTGFDAADGGAAQIRVRVASGTSGTPTLTTLAEDTLTPIAEGTSFVLVTNVGITGNSVPVGVCVGAPAFVEACRTADAGVDEPDAGEPDAGEIDSGVPDSGTPDGGTEPEPMPQGCGCQGGVGPLSLAAMALLGALRRRRV